MTFVSNVFASIGMDACRFAAQLSLWNFKNQDLYVIIYFLIYVVRFFGYLSMGIGSLVARNSVPSHEGTSCSPGRTLKVLCFLCFLCFLY